MKAAATPMLALSWLLVALFLCAQAAAAATCDDVDHDGQFYTVCRVDTRSDRIGLFQRDASGVPFQTLAQLAASLALTGRTLTFGMNAGMFEENFGPVGLYVEEGETKHAANLKDGPGNFHLKPNGVFYVGPDGAGVMETGRFLSAGLHPDFATQSGPMLVIGGAIHPKIQVDGTSLKTRNGVGVKDKHTVLFAISRGPVSFYRFASLFRDKLGCPDALFLDGSVSTLYAPALGRTSQWFPVGPMIGVFENKR